MKWRDAQGSELLQGEQCPQPLNQLSLPAISGSWTAAGDCYIRKQNTRFEKKCNRISVVRLGAGLFAD